MIVSSQAVGTFVCENAPMATHAAHNTPTDASLPLFRMESRLYDGLREAGALEGLDVELREGLLVNRDPFGADALHRLDVGTYERMVATGLLEGLPIELLEGRLVEVSPQGIEHAYVIELLTEHLGKGSARLRVQLPLEVEWGTVIEPDLVLVGRLHPVHRHPRTALLVVEVAVSSHERDRGVKARLYAWAPVPAYWLVDVPGRAVEVRSEPGRWGYSRCKVYGLGDVVPAPAEGVPALDVASLFDAPAA